LGKVPSPVNGHNTSGKSSIPPASGVVSP
jgi:hypothetical protein